MGDHSNHRRCFCCSTLLQPVSHPRLNTRQPFGDYTLSRPYVQQCDVGFSKWKTRTAAATHSESNTVNLFTSWGQLLIITKAANLNSSYRDTSSIKIHFQYTTIDKCISPGLSKWSRRLCCSKKHICYFIFPVIVLAFWVMRWPLSQNCSLTRIAALRVPLWTVECCCWFVQRIILLINPEGVKWKNNSTASSSDKEKSPICCEI